MVEEDALGTIGNFPVLFYDYENASGEASALTTCFWVAGNSKLFQGRIGAQRKNECEMRDEIGWVRPLIN